MMEVQTGQYASDEQSKIRKMSTLQSKTTNAKLDLFKNKVKLPLLMTKSASSNYDFGNIIQLVDKMKMMKNCSCYDESTAKSSQYSELNYLFLQMEPENEREEEIAKFLDLNGIFQINLGYVLKTTK
uniref:Uncharacterized protein n=1 Tax=Euplotes harpa TaxID=151035 RepID=A0A7S3N3Q4_9SPIT|mmetsp:Transcript_17810/g.20572  ORF Transcript_17810/g.20572 Transcript_17810/m.20572 type:complete len:127 (+) Transcript_17810:3-383(+)